YAIFLLIIPPPPISTLFPYTTLFRSAKLVLVKVSERGRITDENIVRGLEWVIQNMRAYNIRVVSMSLGGDEDVSFRESIVDQVRSEEHTSELQSLTNIVCRLLLEKKK